MKRSDPHVMYTYYEKKIAALISIQVPYTYYQVLAALYHYDFDIDLVRLMIDTSIQTECGSIIMI